jgi:hypothetical protein
MKVFMYKFGLKNTAVDTKGAISQVYNYMQYQHEWRILVQTPGLAEGHTTWHYTILPDLTPRSGFTIDQDAVFACVTYQ